MSNFNEYFKNIGLKIMVDRFFRSVDAFNPDYKITKLDYEIENEPPLPASYYLENGLTATHKVKITYEINGDSEDLRFTEFEVPKEIDGAFIIEGAYRISTNKLGNDYDCRMKLEGSGEHVINFDYNHVYNVDKKVLRIKRMNQDLGISDTPIEIRYDKLGEALADPEQRELLRLTKRQITKLQVKLDLDYKPEYITPELIDQCIAFGDDRVRDLIVDKTIDSVATSFMQFLFKDSNGRNFFTARKRIMNYFTKNNFLQRPITSITSLSIRFWKQLEASEIQISPGVNAVNLESIRSKIQIAQSVAYNSSMADLIDIADTPINNNTNLQNSLTVSTHITDTNVLFDVYDKNFNKITIDYLDYLNSKVVASDCVDYERKLVVPLDSGKINIKHRMKRKQSNASDFDLIDLHPDYRLSATTRRIPFVNYTDSVRISMGTSMLKQSIPITNAQRALVDTGNEDDLGANVMNEKFEYPEGTVKEITEDNVVIEVPGSEDVLMPRRSAIQSINDVSVYSEPKVKVGQKVFKGDIINGAVGFEKDTVKAGLNTNVLFHAYHGLVNEDAVVVSESYADRMSSHSIIDLSIDVKSTSALKWIAPIGTRVKSKDAIVTLYKLIRFNEVNKIIDEKLGGIMKGADVSSYTLENHLIVPNNIDDAVVSDILIQENTNMKVPASMKAPDYTFTRTSQAVIDEYMNTKDRRVIYDNYPEYVASDTLDPISLEQKNYKTVYTIRVRLIKYSRVVVGEKITSRYGGKGVCSKIVPDEDMPIVVGPDGVQRRVEVILNPYSTINRKIPSVIMECALGNIAMRLHTMIDEYKRTAEGRKKIRPLLDKYYPGRFDNMNITDFIKLHNSSPIEEVYHFKVGCFSKFTPSQIQEWMDELNVSTQSEVLMPEKDLVDLEEIKANLEPSEYEVYLKSLNGKFTKVDKPLQAGFMTLERLYHIPMYSNKVTSDMQDNRRNEPIAGRGRYRKQGQKIGEMELSVLLSRNAKKFIETSRRGQDREFNQRFLDNLLGLGMMVVDDKGYAQGGSNLKDSLGKLKTKYRLKGGGTGV